MKKRIVSLVLGLILLHILAVPSLAWNQDGQYIMDDVGALTRSEFQFLQIQMSEMSDALDMDIVYACIRDSQLESVSEASRMGTRPNQIVLIETDSELIVKLFGTAEVLTEEDTLMLMEAYTSEEDRFNGITAYLSAAEAVIMEKKNAGMLETQNDVPPVVPMENRSRVVDDANLLDAAQKAQLLLLLDEISERQQFDIVVVTVNSLGGKSPMNYADDFFDYNGYGFGQNHDGILLLVSMEQRDWWISTTGYGITAFTDAGLEYISDRVVPKLSKGQYGNAFRIFAEQCDVFITQARTGEPYDGDHMPKEPFRFGLCLIISVAIGLFSGGCVLWKLQGQLTTVHLQSGAGNYARTTVPHLSVNKETYLYSTMSSHPIPKLSESNNRSGGSSGSFRIGSSIHRSSSGRFHGGRGGKF